MILLCGGIEHLMGMASLIALMLLLPILFGLYIGVSRTGFYKYRIQSMGVAVKASFIVGSVILAFILFLLLFAVSLYAIAN